MRDSISATVGDVICRRWLQGDTVWFERSGGTNVSLGEAGAPISMGRMFDWVRLVCVRVGKTQVTDEEDRTDVRGFGVGQIWAHTQTTAVRLVSVTIRLTHRTDGEDLTNAWGIRVGQIRVHTPTIAVYLYEQRKYTRYAQT